MSPPSSIRGTASIAPESSASILPSSLLPSDSTTLYYEDNSLGTDEFPKAAPCRRIVAIILLTLTIVLLGVSALVVQCQLARLSHDVNSMREREGILRQAVTSLKSFHAAMQAAHAQAEEQLQTQLTSALEERASLQQELAKNEPAPRTLEALGNLGREIEALGATVADAQNEVKNIRKAGGKILEAADEVEARDIKAESMVAEAQREIENMRKAGKDMDKKVEDLDKKVEDLDTKLEAVRKWARCDYDLERRSWCPPDEDDPFGAE